MTWAGGAWGSAPWGADPASGASYVVITCSVGDASAVGVTAGINKTVVATVGAASAVGITAGINKTVVAVVGDAAAAGVTATIVTSGPVTITCSVGTASAIGVTAGVNLATVIACSVGTASAAGITAGVNKTVVASVGAASAAGITASILTPTVVVCSVGSASAQGVTASIVVSNMTLTADDLAAINALITAQIPNIVAATYSHLVETGWTTDELLRIFAAVLAGKVSGAGTGTETFRGILDNKDRVVATVTSNGDRTAITLDAS